jgi:hypothetical protein
MSKIKIEKIPTLARPTIITIITMTRRRTITREEMAVIQRGTRNLPILV